MFPDFLGIGAQRVGTTWLYHNLRKHPDIYMPPLKELHYFDMSAKYPSPNLPPSKNIFLRFYKFGIRRHIKNFNLKTILWGAKYCFGICGDKWYASLFEQGRGKVTGEITPTYSMLDPDDIRHIYSIMPEAKIIFIMRNPIDRNWSQVKYVLSRKHRSLKSVSESELIRIFNSKGYLLRSDYSRTIKNWRMYFPEKQFFICFFDELEAQPESFLSNVYDFLNVARQYIPEDIKRKRNAGLPIKIPLNLKYYLTKLYYPQIKELSQMFGSYPSLWLGEADKVLKAGSS